MKNQNYIANKTSYQQQKIQYVLAKMEYHAKKLEDLLGRKVRVLIEN